MIVIFHSLYLVLKYALKDFRIRTNVRNVMTLIKSPQENVDPQACRAIIDAEENLSFDPPVYKQRYGEIQKILLDNTWKEDIKKVVDFGCAEFKLLQFIKRLCRIEQIFEVDIDEQLLKENLFRIRPLVTDYLSRRTEPLTVHVLCGSISDPDRRLLGVDVVIGIEIIEHLYPDTLDALPYNIFGVFKPKIVVFTTPNSDFNELFPNFKGFRHNDHKFEWSRQQFESWATNIISRYPEYSVSFKGVGEAPKGREELGCCSQMAIFVKEHVSRITNTNCCTCRSRDVSDSSCTCKNCESSVSFGVCKYCSFTERNLESLNLLTESVVKCHENKIITANEYYKKIEIIEYPYDIDERSPEQKILDELKYRIRLIGNINGRFYNEEQNRLEIPLIELIFNQYTHFTTVCEASEILKKADFKIEECIVCEEIETCVICEPEMESRSSTPVSRSRDDSSADKEYYSEWTAGTTEGETSDWEVDSDIQKGAWIVDFSNQEMQTEALKSANEIIHNLVDDVELAITHETNALRTKQNLHLKDGNLSNEEEGKICSEDACEPTNLMYDSGYYKSNTNLTTSPQSCSDAFDPDILDDQLNTTNTEVNTSDKKAVLPANIRLNDHEHAVFSKDFKFKISSHKRRADAVDLTEDSMSLDSSERCHIENCKNVCVNDSNNDKESFVKSAAAVGDLAVETKPNACSNTKTNSFKDNVRECIPGMAVGGASKDCAPGTSDIKKRKKSKRFESDDDDAINGVKIEGAEMTIKIDDKEEMQEPEVVPEAVQVVEPIVENGDLANNNRDLEGNNYPNAQNYNEQNNENDNEHVVLQNNIENDEIDQRNEDIENRNADVEDEEINNEPDFERVRHHGGQHVHELGLEYASREALFDPNSLVDLLADFDFSAVGNDPVIENSEESLPGSVISLGADSTASNVGAVIPINAEPFPNWLLHLLDADFVEDDQHHDEPHFYCQGDGIGVHPSFIEGDFEEHSSSESDSSSGSGSGQHSNSTSSTSSSDTTDADASEPEPTLSEADVGSLPEDANDAELEQNVPVTESVNSENLQHTVISNAGSSSGTESADEFFDTLEESLSISSSGSEKSPAANEVKSMK